MKFIKKIMFFGLLITVITTVPVFAAHSPNWYQENGRYKLKDNAGNVITNAWVCDDMDDEKPWYLLDLYGNMVAGLALDNGSWYFLGPNGQLKFDSGYYDGVYLDIDYSSGVIKNVENVTFLIMKSGGLVAYVNTNNSPVYTSSLTNHNANHSSSIDTDMPPSYNDPSIFAKDCIWNDRELCALIEQTLQEFDSSHLQFHAGGGLDATTVIDPLRGCSIWTVTGQHLRCIFLDPDTGEKYQMTVNRIAEDIKWAIYKLRK